MMTSTDGKTSLSTNETTTRFTRCRWARILDPAIRKFPFSAYQLWPIIFAAISELVRAWNFGAPASTLAITALVCIEDTEQAKPTSLVIVVPQKGQQNLIPCRWSTIPDPSKGKFPISAYNFWLIIIIVAAISEVVLELANRAFREYNSESAIPHDTTDALIQKSLVCQSEQIVKVKGLLNLTPTELARLEMSDRVLTLLKVFLKG